jgi:SAM-dependent methyltransferase
MEDLMFGWINPNDYSFNSFLLFERFQIRMIFDSNGWCLNNAEWKSKMGIALRANPAVKWYFEKLCPECAPIAMELSANAPAAADEKQIREAEIFLLSCAEVFTIYTTPEFMAANCDFIRGWSKERLYDLADFNGKIVLDVGAGSGRLTFAAAEKAAWVYASEPVCALREFIKSKNAKNVRVVDGFATDLPYPDNTFDIVMSGHVVGELWDEEIAESSRVCKPGGWLLDCAGDSERDIKPKPELTERGFEEIHYIGNFGKDVYNYRKHFK